MFIQRISNLSVDLCRASHYAFSRLVVDKFRVWTIPFTLHFILCVLCVQFFFFFHFSLALYLPSARIFRSLGFQITSLLASSLSLIRCACICFIYEVHNISIGLMEPIQIVHKLRLFFIFFFVVYFHVVLFECMYSALNINYNGYDIHCHISFSSMCMSQ